MTIAELGAMGEFLGSMPDGEEAYIDALRAMASVLYGKALQPSGKRIFLDKADACIPG